MYLSRDKIKEIVEINYLYFFYDCIIKLLYFFKERERERDNYFMTEIYNI